VKYTFKGVLNDCASSSKSYSGARIAAAGRGSLSCGQGKSRGLATVKWKNRSRSTVKFTTTSFGALVYVQGRVTKGPFKGDPAGGPLVFEANPPDCFSKAGVKTAKFDGGTGVGNYK
jgi:hypothetical protein